MSISLSSVAVLFGVCGADGGAGGTVWLQDSAEGEMGKGAPASFCGCLCYRAGSLCQFCVKFPNSTIFQVKSRYHITKRP